MHQMFRLENFEFSKLLFLFRDFRKINWKLVSYINL